MSCYHFGRKYQWSEPEQRTLTGQQRQNTVVQCCRDRTLLDRLERGEMARNVIAAKY